MTAIRNEIHKTPASRPTQPWRPPEQLLRDLLDQLGGLLTDLKELAELAGEKLAAMRRADAMRLQEIAAREGTLLNGLFRREPARKATLARAAQELRCPEPDRANLSWIAACVPEPLGSALRARAAALQAVALDLQRKNGLAANVARNLQSHIRGIFAAVAGAETAPVYGPRGRTTTSSGRKWVDAVG